MENYLLIDGEKFFFQEQKLVHGMKAMDLAVAEENFRLFQDVVHTSGLRYGLIFGTLLGAIREKGFIPHDEDTDIFLLNEDVDAFLRLLPRLKEKGLEVVRFPGSYISLMRKNEYIDVYFFVERQKWGGRRVRVSRDDFELPARYLEETDSFPFLGVETRVPRQAESVLVKLYGKDWRVPRKDKFAEPNSLNSKISKTIRRVFGSSLNCKWKEDLKKFMARF